MKSAPASILAVVAIVMLLACGKSEAKRQVLENGAIREYSQPELDARIADGGLADTSLIFDGAAWILFKDYPRTAVLCEARRKKMAAAAIVVRAQDQAPASPSSPIPSAAAAPMMEINANNPGEQIDIRAYLVPGKTVIFDFHSKYCGPCVAIAPKLEQLASSRTDVVVRSIDIDRSGSNGIDWESPVAQQYLSHASGIPYFMIYDENGNLKSEGDQAKRQVREMLGR